MHSGIITSIVAEYTIKDAKIDTWTKYLVADVFSVKQHDFQCVGFDCGVFSVLTETKGSIVNGSILSMISLEIIGVYIIYHFLKKVV